MVESGEKWCVVERMWQSGCGAIHEVVRGETAISGDKRVFIMFMGEYSHTIDAKGRLIIPSKFREQLGEEFVLTKGLDGCLSIYPNDEWAAFEEKLRALPLTNKNARTFSRFFVVGAAPPRRLPSPPPARATAPVSTHHKQKSRSPAS